MNELLKPYLHQLWLSDKEISIYLAWLWFGKWEKSLTYSQYTGINRTTIYSVINELVQKWFMKQSPKKGAKLFYSVQLEQIINNFEQKIDLFKQSLPHINSLLSYTQEKPQIHYYEWLYNIMREYNQILQNNKEVCAFVWDLQISDQIKTHLQTTFFPLKVKKWVTSKTIVSHTNELFPADWDTFLRTRKIYPFINIPTNLIINIYWKSSIMVVDINEPHYHMLIIQSSKIYDFIKSFFEFIRNQK